MFIFFCLNEFGEKMKLKKEFYLQDGISLAKNLLGKTLVHKTKEGITKGIIVETEAYMGKIDDASHSYKKSTKRTHIQYKEGGYSYVYMIYGIHYNFNITASIKNNPESVLIGAIEPTYGIDLMKKRRNINDVKKLCNGPAKLAQAFGITKEQYGLDLTKDELYLEEGINNFEIQESKRINVEYATKCKDKLWRFTIKDNKYLSKK